MTLAFLRGERSLENRKKRVHSFKKVCEGGFKLEGLLSVLFATFVFFCKNEACVN